MGDMIKATQLSELAICLEDNDPRISDLARLFFHELSCKDQGNSIYNIIPDTVSNLSISTSKWRYFHSFSFFLYFVYQSL
jgi:condensin complex subunit 1